MISIIVPVLNEANGIERLLSFLLKEANNPDALEILIVDGGSSDGTVAIVEKLSRSKSNIQLLTSEKGRAKQMNLGAKASTGTILYFLHADSFPPSRFDAYILEAIHTEKEAGCFRMKFDSRHWWLKLAGWFTRFSWRSCRGGDQSLFISRTLFEEIGGYDEAYEVYEDNVLINELYARNSFTVLPHWLTTSARRYRSNGVGKLQYHFWMIYLKRWFGASPESLLRYYKKHIVS